MNSAVKLDLELVNKVRVNRSAVEAFVQNLPARRSLKQKEQAVGYFHAIACMDLTTLRGDDTFGRVDRLCAKAKEPVTPELFRAVLNKFKLPEFKLQAAAVCVYPKEVEEAVRCLKGSGIPVASVATGFPAGQTFAKVKEFEITEAVGLGAEEIDVVISRDKALTGDWPGLYYELVRFREWCGEAKMKTILEISDLQDLNTVAKASLVAMMAGSDSIKTSTGLGDHGGTFEAGLVMAWQILEFFRYFGTRVAFKVAGGVRKAKEANQWLILMKEELGDEWTYPDLFRIGASSLLADIEMQLEHLATGEYSSAERHPKG